MNAFNAMLARFEPLVLSIFRIITGLLLFQFGVAKVLKFPVVPPFDKVAPWSLFWCAGCDRTGARRPADPRPVLPDRGLHPVR